MTLMKRMSTFSVAAFVVFFGATLVLPPDPLPETLLAAMVYLCGGFLLGIGIAREEFERKVRHD